MPSRSGTCTRGAPSPTTRAARTRALGWDTCAGDGSCGKYLSERAYGHTGYTGTSMWIDPERSMFVVLLMNRVNSRGASEEHLPIRRAVADAAQSAILDAPLIAWESRLRKTSESPP